MDKRKFIYVSALLMLILIIFTACETGGGESDEEFGKISLDTNMLYLTVGDIHNFVVKKADKSAKIKWKVEHDELAKIDENGALTAKAVGITKITAENQEGSSASANLVIGDAIVSKAYANAGKKRYGSINAAAEEGGMIIVMPGVYDEYVESENRITLYGVDAVSIRGAKAKALTVENIAIVADTAPAVNAALLSADEALTIKNCNLSVVKNADKPQDNAGGYAVYAPESLKSLSVTGTTVTNFNYGIFIDRASANISITDNSISKNKYGIGVNLSRNMSNAEAKGIIGNNIYNECYKLTEFIFVGGEYSGELNFDDHYSIEPPDTSDKNS